MFFLIVKDHFEGKPGNLDGGLHSEAQKIVIENGTGTENEIIDLSKCQICFHFLFPLLSQFNGHVCSG